MRNVALVISILAVPVIFIGLIDRIHDWKPGTTLLLYGLLAVGVFFIPFLLESGKKRIKYTVFLAILSACVLTSVLLLGALYKIQNWEGGDLMITISLGGLAVITIPFIARYFYERITNSSGK